MENISAYKRGDIVLVDFGKTEGSEQGGKRPALIISNDMGNSHSPTVIVAPLTSRNKRPDIPTHYTVTSDEENNLRLSSVVIFEQITTINKTKIRKKTGCISDTMMAGINRALAVSVGLSV